MTSREAKTGWAQTATRHLRRILLSIAANDPKNNDMAILKTSTRASASARQTVDGATYERLAKLVKEDDIALLRAIFERMGRYAEGVDAERFRIDFKTQRSAIDGLVGRFIKEEYEPRKTYRPNLIAIPLIDNERSRELLEIINKILGHMSQAYEGEPGKQITLMEMSKELDINLVRISDAMGFLIDTPAAGGRRSGLPATPNWYIIPGEQSLDYPDLRSILDTLIGWAEQPAGLPPEYVSDDPDLTHIERMKAWVARNKTLSFILALIASLVAVTGFLADAASVLSFFGQFIPGI